MRQDIVKRLCEVVGLSYFIFGSTINVLYPFF